MVLGRLFSGLKAFASEQVAIVKGDRLAVIGAAILSVFVLAAIFAPLIAPYDPMEMGRDEEGRVLYLLPPSAKHLFGTTNLGRDIFSQVVLGTRVALLVGFLAALLVTVVGVTVGLCAGYYGGRVDALLMRVVDVAYTVPFEPFVIILVNILRPNVWNLILAMILVMWRSPARTIRAQVMSISQRPYIKAARVAGASNFRIIFCHIAPNIMPLMFLYVALTVGWAIMAEAGVSFLGFGDPRITSWGQILQLAFLTGAMRQAWWWTVPPGLCITLVVLSVYFISRAYEKVANPRLQE